MQKQMKSLFVALVCMTIPVMAQKTDLVNPIIGTNGMGHTFPGACAPFGIVQVSPDTDTIPHNIDGVYQPRAYEYCAGSNIRTAPSSASAIRISAEQGIPISVISC